jgi:hypothetical protein
MNSGGDRALIPGQPNLAEGFRAGDPVEPWTQIPVAPYADVEVWFDAKWSELHGVRQREIGHRANTFLGDMRGVCRVQSPHYR